MTSFLFERDFDQEIETEGQAPVPEVVGPDPARMAELLRQAREEAFEAGRSEGYATAEAEMQASLLAEQNATLAALLPQIEALRQNEAAHRRQMEQDLTGLTLFLAQNILPEVLEAFGARRIKAFVRQALRMAEGPLEIRLSAPMHEALAPILSPLSTGQGASVRFLADESLNRHEARALWLGGGATYDSKSIHDALLNTLKTLADGTGS